jgi:hypothetical protein
MTNDRLGGRSTPDARRPARDWDPGPKLGREAAPLTWQMPPLRSRAGARPGTGSPVRVVSGLSTMAPASGPPVEQMADADRRHGPVMPDSRAGVRDAVAGHVASIAPVGGAPAVDNRAESVDNQAPLWTSRPCATDNRHPWRGRSGHPRAVLGPPSELSTVRSTVATPERRRLSTATGWSSTASARTATRGRPPGPHHDDGDDGTKIRGRYPRTMHLGMRSRSRPAHWPRPVTFGVNPT